MSQVRLDRIWEHNKVLPYILGFIQDEIAKITPLHKILLYGSRAKTPVEDWEKLEGHDWDIIIVANTRIVNCEYWTINKNYHVDLRVEPKEFYEKIANGIGKTIELYPNNELNLKLSYE